MRVVPASSSRSRPDSPAPLRPLHERSQPGSVDRGRVPQPFVGRDEQTAVLRDEWARARQGASRIVWVSGPSGIGKTALVRHALADVEPPGLLWTGADESEQALTFGLVGQLRAVGRRLVSARDPGSDVPPPGATPFDVGAELLADMSAVAHPLAVVVDDLQWCDEASAAALLFALRRLEAEALLVVLVTRTDPRTALGESWSRFLGDAHRVRPVPVGGLTAAEVADLAVARGAGRLDPEAARRLCEHTGGHPLHSAVLLDEVGAVAFAGATGVLPAPRSLADITRARVGALPRTARHLIEAGAVLGTTFPFDLAAAVGEVAMPSAALGAAISAGLVESGPGRRVAFAHPLLRGAVYATLSPERRRTLHDAAAAGTSGTTRLLHRVGAAIGPDAELAADLDATAAAEAAAGAYATAADLLLHASAVSTDPATREARLLAAVETLFQGGYHLRARDQRPAVEACGPGALRTFVLGLMELSEGRFHAAGLRLGAAAESAATSGDDALRSRALTGRAFALWFGGDCEHGVEAADEALRGDPGWGGGLAVYVRAMCLIQLGRLHELGAGIDIRHRLTDVDRIAVRGIVAYYEGRVEQAIADLSEVERRHRQGEPSQLFLVSIGLLAEAEVRTGHWDEAALHVDLAISLSTATEQVLGLLHAHTIAAEIDAGRGRLAAAAEHLDVAHALVGEAPSWLSRSRLLVARATVAVAAGDAPALQAAAAELRSEPLRSHLEALPSWRWRSLVVEAHLDANEVTDAAAALAGMAEVVRTSGQVLAVPDLARLRGRLAEARGEPDTALRLYRSVEPACAVAAPLAWARLQAAVGRLLRRRGDRRGAAAALRDAHEVLTRLGATPYLDRCAVELAECGLRAPDAGDPDVLALTAREEAVALLIADGLTNREAAAQLYVSTKTIEYHLGNIYAKLGINTRRELARRLRGADLATR